MNKAAKELNEISVQLESGLNKGVEQLASELTLVNILRILLGRK